MITKARKAHLRFAIDTEGAHEEGKRNEAHEGAKGVHHHPGAAPGNANGAAADALASRALRLWVGAR